MHGEGIPLGRGLRRSIETGARTVEVLDYSRKKVQKKSLDRRTVIVHGTQK